MLNISHIMAVCGVVAALNLVTPAQADGVSSPHVLRAQQYWMNLTQRPANQGGVVNYYGGPVVSNVQIVSVLWGPNVDPTTVSGVPEFLTDLANSTYVDQLSIYDTFLRGVNGHEGTKQHIGRVTFFGQVQIPPKHMSLNITDEDIIKELKYQIGTGVLPPQTPNMWYVIYFPENVSIFLPGYGYSCSDWYAYHWSSVREKRASKTNIYYAVEPECDGGFDTITWTSSHEFAETLTDPVSTGGTPTYPDAWVTSYYAEIGDLCMGYYGMLTAGTNSYLVQQVYLDSIPGCSTGNYTSPSLPL